MMMGAVCAHHTLPSPGRQVMRDVEGWNGIPAQGSLPHNEIVGNHLKSGRAAVGVRVLAGEQPLAAGIFYI